MSKTKNLLIGDRKISELERALIGNLTIYKNLVKRINDIQPNLCITSILKENICWIIGNLGRIKEDGKLIDYQISWVKNTLEITCTNLKKEPVIIIIDVIRNKLFQRKYY